MSDELKTIKMIADQPLKDKEVRFRELLEVKPYSSVGVVKWERGDEFPDNWMVFFNSNADPHCFQESINAGNNVRVRLEKDGINWNVTKTTITKPNVEIPEPSLEEQHREMEALGNDY